MKRSGIRRSNKSGKTVSAEALPLRTLPRGGRLRPRKIVWKNFGITKVGRASMLDSAIIYEESTVAKIVTAKAKTQLQRRKLVASLRSKGHKHQKAALDKLCRAIVFARDPACCRCGKKEQGQWCHVSSRRYVSLRWRLENSLRLCAGCHLLWHHQPLQSVAWFVETYKDRWRIITNAQMSPKRVDLKLERIALEAAAKQYGIAS